MGILYPHFWGDLRTGYDLGIVRTIVLTKTVNISEAMTWRSAHLSTLKFPLGARTIFKINRKVLFIGSPDRGRDQKKSEERKFHERILRLSLHDSFEAPLR
jgi:hypothetical protein